MAAGAGEIKYTYPVLQQLSVVPDPPTARKGSEAQYEAYQSIFAHIMFAHIDQTVAEAEMSPYEVLCRKNHISLFPLTNDEHIHAYNGIYFKGKTMTHYIAKRDAVKLDPYDLYQARGTQGFCQMFAYFMYMRDLDGFVVVDQSRKIDDANFKKLAWNTYVCGQKAINLIQSDKDVFAKFKGEYDQIMESRSDRDHFGIKEGTSVEKYLDEFKKLTLLSTMLYIYDQPLVEWPFGKPKPSLWSVITNGKEDVDTNRLYNTTVARSRARSRGVNENNFARGRTAARGRTRSRTTSRSRTTARGRTAARGRGAYRREEDKDKDKDNDI